ncbi:MAG: hypothetical protein D4R70_02705 [Betaproteobacteria bacterium]|nr:MAG: hypothetical protein D4R70_02705 [Betaproteobacteria bacterium]
MQDINATHPHARWLTAAVLAITSLSGVAASNNTPNGATLLSMCTGTDKVRTLAVMCHSYTNGYIAAANFYAIKRSGKSLFCIPENSKQHIPLLITSRINATPSLKSRPASDILHEIFSQNFTCK